MGPQRAAGHNAKRRRLGLNDQIPKHDVLVLTGQLDLLETMLEFLTQGATLTGRLFPPNFRLLSRDRRTERWLACPRHPRQP